MDGVRLRSLYHQNRDNNMYGTSILGNKIYDWLNDWFVYLLTDLDNDVAESAESPHHARQRHAKYTYYEHNSQMNTLISPID